MQASPSLIPTTLSGQLFVLVKQLMLDPEADHLRAIEENDLTVSQVRALMLLAGSDEPVPGARIAERLGFSPAAVSRALDGLVRDGFVVRSESAEDRRVRPVRGHAIAAGTSPMSSAPCAAPSSSASSSGSSPASATPSRLRWTRSSDR